MKSIFNRRTNLPSYRGSAVSGGFNCDKGVPTFAGTMGRKCGMMATLMTVLCVTSSFADPTPLDKKTVSSKAYVDTSVGLKQPKIPAAGTNSGTIGTSVVTYTSTGNGTIGERGIYSNANPANYNSTNDSNKLVTAAALNGAVTNLPTMETSKLTCVDTPDCTLWAIEDQEVYGGGNNNSGN